MTRAPLLPVEEAQRRALAPLTTVGSEVIALTLAHGRVLASDVHARLTQPPLAASAMDGYAVRAADTAEASAATPVTLEIIAETAAGALPAAAIAPGQAVRIFTGAPVPPAADAIVIQENTRVIQENARQSGQSVEILASVSPGKFVRPAGLDFALGEVLLQAGTRLSARDLGLAAAADVPWLTVRRRPRVAIFTSGDELVRPGEPRSPAQIVNSNGIALQALITAAGAEATDLGIAGDTVADLKRVAAMTRGFDLIIACGGASVGDHDLVQKALSSEGLAVDFWRIAMRPGKPLLSGAFNGTPFLGLPGNPVSALVCAYLFALPMVRRLLGRNPALPALETVILGTLLPANDERQDYLRARLITGPDGRTSAVPANRQDSSMLKTLAAADALIVRPPFAPAAESGDPVTIFRLNAGDA